MRQVFKHKLVAPIATSDTLVVATSEQIDEMRFHDSGHVLVNETDDVRYTSPDDFTLACDGNGTVTMTWLSATTLDTNDTIRVGIAMVDAIVNASGSGGGGDASATKQDAQTALLTDMKAQLQSLIDDTSTANVASKPRIAATWTPSVDSTALAAGDVIADTETINAFFRAADTGTSLIAMTVLDKTDNTGANLDMTFVFLKTNASLGTENSAPSITDANAENIIGMIRVQATDVVDLGGAKVAYVQPKPVPLVPLAGTDDLAVAIYSGNAGAPDFDASALVVNFIVLD